MDNIILRGSYCLKILDIVFMDKRLLSYMCGSWVYSPNNDLRIAEGHPGLPNILHAELYALFVALTTTKDQSQNTYTFTDSPNNIYFISHHICHPFSS